MLGYNVSSKGLKVDGAKVEKLPPPSTVKGVISFLVQFYRRFINDISKIVKPLCNLLEKDETFKFGETCLQAFEKLKARLTSTPIVATPDW